DNFGYEQVVRGVTEHPLEPAAARTEGETGYARRRDAPTGRREPMRLRGGVELAPVHAGLCPYHTSLRIDVDPVHWREVEHDAVVADGMAVDAVATALDGQRQTGL